MIDLQPEYLDLAQTILAKYLSGTKTRVYIFGSRTTFRAKKFSDLDICLQPSDTFTLSSNTLLALQREFEESDFPYFVDIIDYNTCDLGFRSIIDQTKVLWLTF